MVLIVVTNNYKAWKVFLLYIRLVVIFYFMYRYIIFLFNFLRWIRIVFGIPRRLMTQQILIPLRRPTYVYYYSTTPSLWIFFISQVQTCALWRDSSRPILEHIMGRSIYHHFPFLLLYDLCFRCRANCKIPTISTLLKILFVL